MYREQRYRIQDMQGTGAYDYNGVIQVFFWGGGLLTIEAEPVEVPNVVQGYMVQGMRYAGTGFPGTGYPGTGYLVTFCRSRTSRGTPWYRLAILALAIFLIATGKLSRIRLYTD